MQSIGFITRFNGIFNICDCIEKIIKRKVNERSQVQNLRVRCFARIILDGTVEVSLGVFQKSDFGLSLNRLV